MRAETVLVAQARRYPEKVALVCGPERVAYAELKSRVEQAASGLLRAGLKPGDRILLCLPNGTAIVELFYAAFSLGLLVVPVTTRLTAHEIAHICRDSAPAAIAFAEDGAAIRSVLDAHPEALPISVGAAAPPGATAYRDLRAGPAEALPRLPAEPEDAMIMYTSGTTGRPKGALITHSNLVVQHGFMNGLEWGIGPDDVYIVTTPLAHRTGFARLANALTLGGTLVVMGRFDPRETVDTIAREGVTVAGMVPTVCRMLLPEIEADPSRCASLRRIVVTGEAFPVELKRRLLGLLPDVKLASFFAMTEAGGVTSLGHDEQFTHPASVGRPTPGVEVRLAGEDGRDVPVGEAGELWVRAGAPGRYSVMRGYYNLPDATADAFQDGWLKTGDMARLDPEGYLTIVDRKKDMILSGGFNIYSKEVESALVSCPGVADAAVVGVPDDIYGEAVAAFVERSPGQDPRPAAIVDHARTRLAGYKKPKHVFVVDALPRNSLGKVLKGPLRDEALKRTGAAGEAAG